MKTIHTPPLTLLVLLGGGCTPAMPFEGPGWDRDAGLTMDLEGPVTLSATYAHVEKGERNNFDDHVDRILDALEDGPEGLIGYSLRAEIMGDEAWTISAWTDDDAVMAFVSSEAHLAAMGDASTILEEAAFARWQVEPEALAIDWEGDILPRLEAAAADGGGY